MKYLLLLLSCSITSSSDPASSFFKSFASRVNWPLPSQHTPNFYATRENITLLGSFGVYNITVFAIRDASPPANGGVIAAYIPAASENVEGWKQGVTPELNLLVPLPALAPQSLPAIPRYGWSWLYGAKVVTIPWLDCCNITGDSSGFSFSDDFRDVWTLTQFQSWYPNGKYKGRDAQSIHTFTLCWDPTVGYRIDMVTSIIINTGSAPRTIEFVNFLTPQLANPWPFPAAHDFLPSTRSTVTAWSSDVGVNWQGFAENILAGAMLHTYNVSLVNSSSVGAVVMAASGSYSAALAFSGDGLTFLQATCPTWMDQHQIVVLPPPGPDGYVACSPTFSLAYLPSAASDDILSRVSLITHKGDGTRGNGSSVFLRLGVVENFEDQPVSLTTPLRALAQVWSSPDFMLMKNGGNRNGTALAIKTLPPSEADQFYAFAISVPLVPLNVSTMYSFRALTLAPSTDVCPPGFSATAKLAVGIYEDDDFNTQERLLWFNSSVATGGESWVNLSVSFMSPPWPSYADIRFMSIGADDSQPCESNATALFDDVYFGEE